MDFLHGIPNGFVFGIWLAIFSMPTIAILWLCGQKPPNCPGCKEQQKFPRWPSSFRQAMCGGWVCHKCGCKMDGGGNEVVF